MNNIIHTNRKYNGFIFIFEMIYWNCIQIKIMLKLKLKSYIWIIALCLIKLSYLKFKGGEVGDRIKEVVEFKLLSTIQK